jgi:hypothetical protein
LAVDLAHKREEGAKIPLPQPFHHQPPKNTSKDVLPLTAIMAKLGFWRNRRNMGEAMTGGEESIESPGIAVPTRRSRLSAPVTIQTRAPKNHPAEERRKTTWPNKKPLAG